MIIYHVDRANVLEAIAFANDTRLQLKQLGANKTSNSKTMTDDNVKLLDRHKAVR
jgi:hypothetical protein